tara:strand:+ start:39 stop:266 length:228 start_codon:yes stop_codon:yes gene_type:complete
MSGQTNYYVNMAKCGKPTCTEESIKAYKKRIEESNVKVSDKRSMFNEVWSKHKKTIIIIGALGIGYFAYKKFIKK